MFGVNGSAVFPQGLHVESMASEPICDLKEESNDDWMNIIQWSVAMGGAILFVIFSKVTLLLNPIMGKSWYTDLMTYLIALAMGTMLCVTVFQLIPEALNLLEEKELYVYCGQLRLIRNSFDNGLNGRSGNGLVVKHNCDIKCNDTSEHGKASGIDEPENSCTLTIGGPKNYVPVVCVLYLCTIIFYDLQKFLQYAFSNEDGTHLAELEDPPSEDLIAEDADKAILKKFKYGNRQQSIAFAAKMANIPTAVNLEAPYSEETCSSRKMSMRRSRLPSQANLKLLQRRSSQAFRKASIYRANMALQNAEFDDDSTLNDNSMPNSQKISRRDSTNNHPNSGGVTSNSEDSYVTIPKEGKKSKEVHVKFGEVTVAAEEDDELDVAGKRYSKTADRRNTGLPLVKMPAERDDSDDDSIKTETISNTEMSNNHDAPQDWKKVDMVAWILLLCIAFECLIEGIAFALTLSDELGAGIAILAAMIIKLIPQKLGDAVILSKAGLNHFWENVLSLLAVCFVFVGTILGMSLKTYLKDGEEYFFGALAGIFLYISLSSLFPVLHDIIDDTEVIGDFDMDENEAFRRQQLKRLLLANFGFFSAMALMVPLIWFEHELQVAITNLICEAIKDENGLH